MPPPDTSLELTPHRSALAEEVEAINSIYGDSTLSLIAIASGGPSGDNANAWTHATLRVPGEQPSFSFTLTFAPDYPDSTPLVDGTASSTTRTGSKREGEEGAAAAEAEALREVVARVWAPGAVCLFDVIEEVRLVEFGSAPQKQRARTKHDGETEIAREEGEEESGERSAEETCANPGGKEADDASSVLVAGKVSVSCYSPAPAPKWAWTVSDPVTEKKSVFVARCAVVTNPEAVATSRAHLVTSSKKIANATHNIAAWRIRPQLETGITVQEDCDDDGETAAGGRLLHLMQVMDVWNVVVVVTRWYGGTKLGADRFRIINGAARDALVRGGFVKSGEEKKGNGGKKKRGKK